MRSLCNADAPASGWFVTLDADEEVPLRYWMVANMLAQNSVMVTAGKGDNPGRVLGVVPAGKLLGFPCDELDHITFTVSGGHAATAGDTVIVGASPAHLPPAAGSV